MKRKLTLPLAVASFTFLVGLGAASNWYFHRKPVVMEALSVVPDHTWETSFSAAVNEHGRAVNLSELRSATLPSEDFEVRLWYSALPDQVYGVILSRLGNAWTASFLYGTSERKFGQPFQMRKKQLDAPKSGWDSAWERLRVAELLTLPDASNVPCRSEAFDGMTYVVETNVNGKYRIYHYANPQLMKCSEAEKMIKLAEIVEEEFDLWNPKYRE